MTLYRQLVIVIVTLFVLMFGGTLWVNFESTRAFLLDQLESHAQDTATSLGLSLSTHMQQEDRALMASMVDAIFDRGYYKRIRVEDNAGQALVERKIPVVVEGVPDWFVAHVQLKVPQASALVMAGWHQVGRVQVWSHPGYAYRELWRSSVETAAWFAAAAVLLLILGAVALRVLLKPLKAVERQAEQLARRQYEPQTRLPRTRELRSVVVAMNRLTEKVRGMFEEQARAARRLRALSYEDPLTGLANRRLFDDELDTHLAPEAEFGRGSLLLVQLQGLMAINEQQGFAAGDALLEQVAVLLRRHAPPELHATVARLGGGDFALLVPGTDDEAGDRVAEAICRDFAGYVTTEAAAVNVGITHYGPGMERESLLESVDAALRAAQALGPDRWARQPVVEGTPVGGRHEWEQRLRHALADAGLKLYVQPVVDRAGQPLHREVLVRIADAQGVTWPAGVFMPLAEALGLGRELDQAVLRLVCEQLRKESGALPLAINLTAGSVEDSAFVEWLFATLASAQVSPQAVQFEFSEAVALGRGEALEVLAARLRQAGHRYGIDHFGRGLADFGYLRSLQPDYVKIDPTFNRDIVDSSDRQFFVRSLTAVAHSLDVEVIAEAVESAAQQQALLELDVDGMQGFFIGRPEPLQP